MPTQEQRDALLAELDKCAPEAWVALVSFCAPEMVAANDQRLLAEIVCREAERRADRASRDKALHFPSDHLASVLDDVDLKIAVI